jgi:hypothetical protein
VRLPASLLLLAALATGGCGYALVGRGVTTDPSIKRIGVPLFKDETGKAGLDQKITQAVIEELLKRGRFDVVQESAGVDALVEATLASYHAPPVGFSEESAAAGGGRRTQASRYAITLTAKVRYAKVGAEEAIWENDAFTFREEYDLGDDSESFFDREEQALDRLAEAFARSLVAAMLEAF